MRYQSVNELHGARRLSSAAFHAHFLLFFLLLLLPTIAQFFFATLALR